MPVFAVASCFVRTAVWLSRERRVSGEAGFGLTRDRPEVRGLADDARRGGPVERFGVRVVALRVADPDPAFAADFDVLRERFDLVAVLALVRRGLVLGRGLAPRALLGLAALGAATFFDARPSAAGCLLLDALVPSERSLLVDA